MPFPWRAWSLPPWSLALVHEHRMDTDAGNLDKSESEDAGVVSAGAFFAGLARASLFSFKKSIVMIPVKKQAFLQIGRLTHTKATASQIDTTTMDTVNCASKPSFFRKGLTKELAKSTVLGITVFGTYEYIVHHYMKVNGDTDARSTLLAHMGAGACAGLVQSSVLCTWELISKLTSHSSVPHNLRGSFLTRRAVHHATGYASLFGTFEAMRRLLMYASHPLEEKNPLSTSLVAAFLAGGIAGQVHHFVNYVTSHWKLQLSMDLIKHTRQYVLLPNLRANLSAFGPTALCFVAFHYGEELTERIRNNVDTAMV